MTNNITVSDAHLDHLRNLGVPPDLLSPEEREQLDRFGFLMVPDLLNAEQIKDLKIAIDDLLFSEAELAGTEFHKEAGARRLANLMNKGSIFQQVWLNPKILAAAQHVIARDFKVSSLNMRESIRGHGHQALHADWGILRPGEPFCVLNAIVAIDPLNSQNGAPRYVPGSHLFKPMKEEGITDPKAPHPLEKIVSCAAGSAFIMNAHLWHGGTTNGSGQRRRTLHAYFCARDVKQQQDQRKLLLKSTWDQLAPSARYLLDVI